MLKLKTNCLLKIIKEAQKFREKLMHQTRCVFFHITHRSSSILKFTNPKVQNMVERYKNRVFQKNYYK